MGTLRLAATIFLVTMEAAAIARAQAPAADAIPAPATPPAPDLPAGEQLARARLSIPLASRMLWNDLHVFQEREAELWSERYSRSVGLPATGIVIGTPLALMLIPWGSVLIADANTGYGGYADENQRLRRTGALMLTSGLLLLGAVVVSIWQVSRVRRRRQAIDSELRALSASRTSIERMLELQQMSTPHPAP